MNLNSKTSKLSIIYIITFLVAFCSIAYELLLAHTISLVAGSTIVWYGIVIGVFLGSLGIGSFLLGKLLLKHRKFDLLLKTELLLTLIGGIVAMAVYFAHSVNVFMIVRGWITLGTVLFIALSLACVVAVGLLSGIELPLLMKIGKTEAEKEVSNRVLAIDYFGSLCGSLVFPIILVPKLNAIMIGFSLACVNFFAAFLISFFFSERLQKSMVTFLTLTSFIVFGFLLSPFLDMYFAKKYYYYIENSENIFTFFAPLDNVPDVKRKQSQYQIIDFVQQSNAGFYTDHIDQYIAPWCKSKTVYGDLELYLNGDWQLNIRTERAYHEFFAHVPVQFAKKVPKKVLVLGGGDGMLDRELLKYEEVEKIVHVDLDSEMIELASKGVLAEINENALSNDKIEVIIGDGYAFIKNTTEVFDAIYIDFPTPVDYNLGRLYSAEFYSFAAKRLKEDGFIALDTPGMKSILDFNNENQLILADDQISLESYFETISYAGFETVIPFVSGFEPDNEKVKLIVKDKVLRAERESREEFGKKSRSAYLLEKKAEKIAELQARKFARNIMEGFVYATKKRTEINVDFQENNIKTCFFNQDRFLLSSKVPFDTIGEADKRNVNSIMKPVLPLSNFSRVRMPYYLN